MTQRHATGDDLQHVLVTLVDQQDPFGVRMGVDRLRASSSEPGIARMDS